MNATMLDAMRAAGLGPAKDLDLHDDGVARHIQLSTQIRHGLRTPADEI